MNEAKTTAAFTSAISDETPASNRSAAVPTDGPLERIHLPTLARRLTRERPRMIAVVATHLAPGRAAKLLKHLPDELQAEVLRCIAGQQPLDEALLREIEQQLGAELQAGLLSPAESPADSLRGLPAVQAILDQTDDAHRRRLANHLIKGDQQLARQLDLDLDVVQNWKTSPYADSFPRTGREAAGDEAHSGVPPADPSAATPHSADIEFDDLNQLDDRSLARVFREADWPTLILALTAAPPELIERLARQLSPRAARMLRHRVEHPGLLRLRDIEIAQQEVAFLIADLAARGFIRLPHRRAFTVAA